jgi:exopolysaccharide biosynthesis polyprenyl glycosylphosphotransferase
MMNLEKSNLKSSWRLRPSERRIILFIGDLVVGFFSLMIGLYFWGQTDWLHFSWSFLQQRPPLWFFLLPFMWLLFLFVELYEIRRSNSSRETVKGILIAAGIATIVYLIVYFTSNDPNTLPRRAVAIFVISVVILTLLWRLLYIRIFAAPQFLRRALIIGGGKAGVAMVKALTENRPSPFILVGVIDDDPAKAHLDIEGTPVMGSNTQMMKIIKKEGITDLIVAITHEMNPRLFQNLIEAEEKGIDVTTMPYVYEGFLRRVPIFYLQSDWLLRSFMDQSHTDSFFEITKRLIDMIGACIGLALILIISPLVIIALLIDDGLPIVHKQERLGKNGKVIQIYKFRTMNKDAEGDGVPRMAIENDERVTRLGRFLRKSHIDELPQFWNVLKGEMSLVGPRAERPEFVELLQKKIPFYRARLFVKPGLSGWAQINQKYAATIEQSGIKLEYDLYYIKQRNILLDFLIILRTLGQVISLRGQ